MHCETEPDLVPLAPLVQDGATLPFPRLVVPYGFHDPRVRQEVLEFLVQNL